MDGDSVTAGVRDRAEALEEAAAEPPAREEIFLCEGTGNVHVQPIYRIFNSLNLCFFFKSTIINQQSCLNRVFVQALIKEVFDMPGFDGTGPMGAGPMTGGGWGNCNPSGRYYGAPRYGLGRGFRGGFGRGRGAWGRGFGRQGAYAPAAGWYGPAYGAPYGNPYPMTPDDEMNMLRDEANGIKNELDAINKRIEELESKSSAS